VEQRTTWGLDRLILRFRDHKNLDTHTQCDPSGRTEEWSARHKDCYLHETRKTQEANIHGLSGILTCNPSSQATADLRLYPADLRLYPADLRLYPADLRLYPADLRLYPADLRLYPADLRLYPADLRLYPADLRLYRMAYGIGSKGLTSSYI